MVTIKWCLDKSGTKEEVVKYLNERTVFTELSENAKELVDGHDEKEFARVKHFLVEEIKHCLTKRIGIYARQVNHDSHATCEISIAEYP